MYLEEGQNISLLVRGGPLSDDPLNVSYEDDVLKKVLGDLPISKG